MPQRDLTTDSAFGQAMLALSEPLDALEVTLGFYRDKFIVHLPAGLLAVAEGRDGMTPLYLRRVAASDEQYRRLRKALNSIFVREGWPERVGDDSLESLIVLGERLHELRDPQNITTAKNLMRDWGEAAPSVADTALRLGELVDLWARTLLLVWHTYREPRPWDAHIVSM